MRTVLVVFLLTWWIFNPTRHFLVTSSGIVPQVPTSLNTGFGASVASKMFIPKKKKKQTERRFLANHLPWCDPWGKFGRKKKGKCLLATLVAHNLKLFSDTTTFLALGRIGTQSYPVSWTELKRSIRDDGMFFFWSFKDYQLLLNHDARIHLLINLQDFMWIIHDSWRSWNDVQTWKKGVPRRWEHHHQPWHFYGLPISPRNPRCDERPHQHLRCLRLASTNICWRKKIFIVFKFSKFDTPKWRLRALFFLDPYLIFWSQGACKNCTLECK